MLDPVPWFIGGEAEHSPEVARMLAYLAANGKEGVVAPGDLKVIPLSVPGAGVRVVAGGASILNRVGSQQAYTVRNPTTDSTSVTFGATGSSSTRADLVVARVQNPYVDGNAQDPDDPVNGPYVAFETIAGVPAGTKSLQTVPGHSGDSAIALARIDFPKSTGTVTSAMITDLRHLANPRSERVFAPGNLGTVAQVVTLSDGWQAFPGAGVPNVAIPSWATHMAARIDTTYNGVSGAPYFNLQAFMSSTQDDTTLFSDVRVDGTKIAGGDQYRSPVILPSQGWVPIPTELRGTTQTFTTRVKGANTATIGSKIATNPQDYYLVDVTFSERTL